MAYNVRLLNGDLTIAARKDAITMMDEFIKHQSELGKLSLIMDKKIKLKKIPLPKFVEVEGDYKIDKSGLVAKAVAKRIAEAFYKNSGVVMAKKKKGGKGGKGC